LWKRLASKDYPNGFVMFCSEELAEVVHPPVPLRRRVYSCGRRFDTSVLRTAVQAEQGAAYGAIAIDGAEATFGTVRGLGALAGSAPQVTQLGHITSTTAARTRRGGQSALRYSRLREEAELAFLRKAAEMAASLFADVRGLVLAGKADMKRKLLPELPQRLRGRVLCCVDLPGSADLDGLRRAAAAAAGAAASKEGGKVDSVAERFLELTLLPEAEGARYCYGEPQCEAALQLGAVDELLLAAEFRGPSGRSAEDWEALASARGATVLKVPPRGEASVRFCDSFGVGAFLRWTVHTDLLEEDTTDADDRPSLAESELEDVPSSPTAYMATPVPVGDVEAEADNSADLAAGAGTDAMEGESPPSRGASPTPAATAAAAAVEREGSSSCLGVLAWLEDELRSAVGASAAEALSVCLEVILMDETTPVEEALLQAGCVLADEGAPREVREAFEDRWREATRGCGAPTLGQ